MKIGYIYIIKNNINNKVYIGQTRMSVEARFKKHLSLQDSNKNMLIYKAIKKYGKSNFYVEIIEETLVDNLNDLEEFYIKKYDSFNNGYNLCRGGNQPNRVKKEFSKEVIDEIVELYISNNSLRFIADKFSITKHNVSSILFDNNIQLRAKSLGLKHYSKISELELRKLYTEKISIRGISRILNVNPSAVRKALVRYGIKNINTGDSR